jgi:hypothetical protein
MHAAFSLYVTHQLSYDVFAKVHKQLDPANDHVDRAIVTDCSDDYAFAMKHGKYSLAYHICFIYRSTTMRQDSLLVSCLSGPALRSCVQPD